ncbi:MAG: transposase [Victivallaceae bacterium]|nr:transposase [Victivallaceae bacterium]
MKKTVYPDRSQVVNEIFKVNDLNKILVVPVDFAKSEHTAHICTGNGEYLLKHPLKIYNNEEGVKYLKERIRRMCGKYNILKEHVIIACEDPPSYMLNFISVFKSLGYVFVRVNAFEAKKFRCNSRASSDKLDLDGICQAVINRRGRDIQDFDSLYSAMKNASRARSKLVKQSTVFKNQIHKCVNILFPDFLNEKKSGLTPFGNASLALMEDKFSVIKIRRKRETGLVKLLARNKVQNPGKSAQKLKSLASKVLTPLPEIIDYYSRSLAAKVKMLKAIQENIYAEENQLARYLIQTPGFYLTSIPGCGVVTAAGIMGESGQLTNWRNIDQLASYAGIVPRQKQTGGSSKSAVQFGLPKKSNKKLKFHLFQLSFNTCRFKHPVGIYCPHLAEHRLYSHFHRISEREGKSGLGTAKLFLKIARQMILRQRIYLPSQWLNSSYSVSSEENRIYFSAVINSLKEKWKAYNFTGISNDKNFLNMEVNAYESLIRFTNSK